MTFAQWTIETIWWLIAIGIAVWLCCKPWHGDTKRESRNRILIGITIMIVFIALSIRTFFNQDTNYWYWFNFARRALNPLTYLWLTAIYLIVVIFRPEYMKAKKDRSWTL